MASKKKKKAAVKKAVKKPAKKVIKKIAKKVAKKVVKKAVKTTAKRTVKKVIKKAGVKKTAAKKQVQKTISKKPSLAPKKVTPIAVDYSKAITPLGDRLVVRVEQGERVTAGGIIIPDTASSIATGYLKAKVLAVGSGGKSKKGHLQPLDVKMGDVVLFSEYSGTKVSFNGEELQIIHESDVMGIVQN